MSEIKCDIHGKQATVHLGSPDGGIEFCVKCYAVSVGKLPTNAVEDPKGTKS